MNTIRPNIKYLQTASTNKAKRDIDKICHDQGYTNISFRTKSQSKIVKFFEKTSTMLLLPRRLKPGDTLCIQYPYKKYYEKICRTARRRGAKTVTIIHDLGAFRRKKLTPEREIEKLALTDVIIVHSPAMKQWLEEHGCKVPMVVLDMFDYYSEAPLPLPKTTSEAQPTVAYAGSLGVRKNKFLYDLPKACPECQFRVYGKGFDTEHAEPAPNFKYEGFVESDRFIADPKANWGLVWDGDSVDDCSGNWGEYLALNNPHKASFYVRAGIPIIVWKGSAMAPFVEGANLGVAVDSLRDLDRVLPSIPYQIYSRTACHYAERLNGGYFFLNAMDKALDILAGKTSSDRQ